MMICPGDVLMLRGVYVLYLYRGPCGWIASAGPESPDIHNLEDRLNRVRQMRQKSVGAVKSPVAVAVAVAAIAVVFGQSEWPNARSAQPANCLFVCLSARARHAARFP